MRDAELGKRPEGLRQVFRAELKQYEQERQMPYVTSIEQMGREEERRSIALRMLQENILLEAIARITEWTIAELQQLQADQSQE
ncbi:MAG: hypothetical protein KME45_27105 [Stenomitos rutilans HA7619-LM2]|nr:hypothetical protein [Stenomitos rutilans HA7619-LM2]